MTLSIDPGCHEVTQCTFLFTPPEALSYRSIAFSWSSGRMLDVAVTLSIHPSSRVLRPAA